MGVLRQITVLVLLAAACAPVAPQGTELAATPAPNFTLTEALSGSELRLGSLRGRVVVLSFLHTHFPDTCPLTADRFREAQKMLGADATKVAFVAVSVDPVGDTAESVRAFTRDHRLEQGWH